MPRSSKQKHIQSMKSALETTPDLETAPDAAPEAPASGPSAASPPLENSLPRRTGGRPALGSQGKFLPSLNIWQQIAKVAPEDWATRVYLYLYVTEPICDLTRNRNKKYLCRYEGPIQDEQAIMTEYGSGRYRLCLSNNKPTFGEKPIADEEFEIMNPKYPPKIPKELWLDDPRNRKWAALLPPPAPPEAPNAAHNEGAMMEGLRVLNEIQRGAREQVKNETPGSRIGEFMETIHAVKELMPPPAPATDNKMLDTVVQLLTAQLTRDAAEAAELRKEIREMRIVPTAAPGAANGISVVKEILTGLKDIMPQIRGILPEAAEGIASAVTGRSRMSGWQEFLQPVLGDIVKGISPVMPHLIGRMFAPQANPAAMQPGMNGAAPASTAQLPAAQPAASSQALNQMMSTLAPAIISRLSIPDATPEELGAEFAEWLDEGFGPQPQIFAKQIGAANILAWLKASPYWKPPGHPEGETLSAHETRLGPFIETFLSWAPKPDEDETKGKAETIDLSAEVGA